MRRSWAVLRIDSCACCHVLKQPRSFSSALSVCPPRSSATASLVRRSPSLSCASTAARTSSAIFFGSAVSMYSVCPRSGVCFSAPRCPRSGSCPSISTCVIRRFAFWMCASNCPIVSIPSCSAGNGRSSTVTCIVRCSFCACGNCCYRLSHGQSLIESDNGIADCRFPIAKCGKIHGCLSVESGNWQSAIGNRQYEMSLTDQQRFEQLVRARHPCVSIVTFEEDYALGVVRHAAVENGWDCSVWTVTNGLRDGLVEGTVRVPDTDHPAAALYHLCRQARARQALFVMLDLAGHLKDERTLRTLRERSEERRVGK